MHIFPHYDAAQETSLDYVGGFCWDNKYLPLNPSAFFGILTRVVLFGSAYLLVPGWRSWACPCSVTRASAGGRDPTVKQGQPASSVSQNALQRGRDHDGTPALEPWIYKAKGTLISSVLHSWNVFMAIKWYEGVFSSPPSLSVGSIH